MEQTAQFDLQQMAEIVIAVIFSLAAFSGAVVLLIKNSKTIGALWQSIRINTCPNHPMICNNLGGLIVFFCAFSKFQGYIDPFDKIWLDSVMKDYEATEQNHGVKAVYDSIQNLPDKPVHRRRITDTDKE